MLTSSLACALISAFILSVSHALPEPGSPTARIDSGIVIGTSTTLPSATAIVHKYLGIPFADSPPERFTPPVKPGRWVRPLVATQLKPACIQQFNGPSRNFTTSVFNSPAPEESEDCLYLNVFTPDAPTDGSGRAVMVWLYGGSLQFGTASLPGYDGSHIAGYQDVVVVTLNYRTNVFGFPSSPDIPLTKRNLGFLDQRAALEWVQRNIAEFGGDPDKVTLFGESAGAASIDALLTSYPKGSKPPFWGAILQSGQVGIRRVSAPTNGSFSWATLIKEAGCAGNATLTCLKQAPASKLKAIIESKALSFGPTTDNYTLVSKPYLKRHEAKVANIPILIGSNAQEGRVFQYGKTDLNAYLKETFPANLTEKVRAAYTLHTQGLHNNYDIISAIMTDLQFTCPTFLQAHGSYVAGYPTWRYYFNATFPNLQTFPNAGVYHASEIDLIFGTHGKLPTATGSKPSPPQEAALSEFMQGAWAKFAKNPAGGPGWSKVGSAHSGRPLNGSEPEDLGVLGGVSSAGVNVVSRKGVDAKCAMFVPLYS